jgi:hypothetical protein
MKVGTRPWWEVTLAAIGASLLLVVAVARWAVPTDEHAYWLAAGRLIEGQPLYDPAATIVTPYTYLYPPPLAQVLVPVAALVPSWLFSIGWTLLMAIALWWLADRDVIRALALAAFPPVAVEFWFRNVHLFLAVLVVLGLRRTAAAYAVGSAIKVSPGLGIVVDAVRGRWQAVAIASTVGLAMLAISFGAHRARRDGAHGAAARAAMTACSSTQRTDHSGAASTSHRPRSLVAPTSTTSTRWRSSHGRGSTSSASTAACASTSARGELPYAPTARPVLQATYPAQS